MLEAMLFNNLAMERPKDSWARLPDLPFARHSAGVTRIDNQVYIFGGQDPSANTVVTNTLYRYNLDTGEVVSLSSAGPTIRTSPTLTAVDGKLYMMGGCATYGKGVGIKDVWCYTPETDSWLRKADMPYARLSHTSLALGSKIYVAAGKSSSGAANMRETLIYDTLTDTWTIGAIIPLNTRFEHSMAEYGGKFYVHAGMVSGSTKHLYCYDPETDSWTTLAQGLQDKARHVAAVVGNRMSVLVGDSQSGLRVYQYDFITGVWVSMQLALISNNQYASAVVYKNEIYIFGGYSNNGVGLFRYTP